MAQTNELDLFAESPELLAEKRKQQLAMALLEQLSKGAPQPEKTRILAKTPLAGVLMNTVGQHFARGDLRDADQRVAEISRGDKEKRLAGYSSATNELMTSPDKNAAIAKFLASGDPMVRALAQAELKAMREREAKAQEQGNSRANALLPVLGNRGMVPEASEVARTGQVPQGLQPPPVVPPKVEWIDDPNKPGQKLPQQIDTKLTGEQSGTLGTAGTSVNLTTNLPGAKQTNAAEEAFGKKVPEVLENASKSARSAIGKLQSAERILDLVKNPDVISGALAEPRVGLAKIGELLGFKSDVAISQTQSLLSELAAQTLANVGRLPGAITEKERPFLAQAAAGSLDYTPEAIAHLARLAQVDSHNQLMHLVKQYDNAAATPGVGANAGMYPFPKGWKFQPDANMEETGLDTNLWRVKERNAAPAGKPAAVPAYKPLNQMTRAEKEAELKRLRGGN